MSPRDNEQNPVLPPDNLVGRADEPEVPAELRAADALLRSGIIVDSEHALHEEYAALFDPPADGEDINRWLAKHPRYALCLSGGGIRSAAFCMGALRALAQNKLLTRFHYLSTVSGGGYIGGWLQRLITEAQNDPRRPAEMSAAESAQATLADTQAQPQVKNLRDFTNFLAPTPGLLAGDLMPGVVLYLRNVIVNWMIFLPAFIAIALVPALYRDLICLVSAPTVKPHGDLPTGLIVLIFAAGLAALFVGILNGCRYLPTHYYDLEASTRDLRQEAARREEREHEQPVEVGADPARIKRYVIYPIMIWAFLLPIGLAVMSPPPESSNGPSADTALGAMPRLDDVRVAIYSAWLEWTVPLAAVAVMIIAFLAAWWWIDNDLPSKEQRKAHREVFLGNAVQWVFACALSGGLLYAVIAAGNFARAEEMAAFGPLLVLAALVLQTTFYVALRLDPLRADLDREWLARLNAGLLEWGIIFAAVAACSLIVPYWLLSDSSGGLTTIGAAIGIASGPAAAMSARAAARFLAKPDGLFASLGFRLFDVLALVAALLFAASLIALLSWAAQNVVESAAGLLGRTADDTGGVPRTWAIDVGVTLSCLGALAVLAWVFGRLININRFSMHAVYRNRIVRAFLGSSRRPSKRRPDRYVRFDPDDNLRMVKLKRSRSGDDAPCLFPVIGATLNLSGGTRTAWTERKAAPFTITPLRCGSAELNHPQLDAILRWLDLRHRRWQLGARPIAGGWTDREPSGAYAMTETYAGKEKIHGEAPEEEKGLSLGTAIALSGAAISSNMGSRTSSALAFLATLFDLRLGMWLPNPADIKFDENWMTSPAGIGILRSKKIPDARFLPMKWRLNEPKPRNTTVSLFEEMLRNTDDVGQSIYLTDGGHFDNLGLYEMLRRRCKCILVIDVGEDPKFAYDDLGTAIRRANLDFDACVEFTKPPKIGSAELQREGLHARITYPERGRLPKEEGDLLIIKPYLPDDTPTEIMAYQASNGAFPHDTTANQFFAESQFESYRRLGEHVTAAALGEIADINQLFAIARAGKSA